MKRIDIVFWHGSMGLVRDAAVLAGALTGAGHRVTCNGYPGVPEPGQRARLPARAVKALGAARAAVTGRHRYDLTLFLEHIRPERLGDAPRSALVPNPEWFRDEIREHLPRIDTVLAKTREALRIFSGLGCRARWIGFTSVDRRTGPEAIARREEFFHLAGRSAQKGTPVLLDLWRAHPEWPRLLVIQAPVDPGGRANPHVAGPNIEHVLAHVDDTRLRRYQNEYRFHLCPSETEGFGHYLVEGMSCGAVVLTTDAPPMNELVQPERGVLAAHGRTGRQRLATNYFVDPAALERTIERLVRMPLAERDRLGSAARQWYEDNDRAFRERLAAAVREA